MRQIPTILILCAIAAWLPSNADAVEIRINRTTPFVYIQVGHGDLRRRGLFGRPSNLIDEVSFTFPVGVQPGDGTPIVGTPVIPVALLGLSAGNQTNFHVTVNSSAPLINEFGDSLPFSEIGWITRDGDIPAGQFDESASQFLMSYTFAPTNRGRGVIDYLTFSYANALIYPAGTYTGRVTYTVTEL
ncbi:MAG: hypothetical protein ACR2QV_02810 [Gammaproteobacteria bacterium]